MKAPQFERPDAARLRAMAAGASASMGGNSIDTMTFGPPGSKGGYGGGFGSWGKGSSGSRYVARNIFTSSNSLILSHCGCPTVTIMHVPVDVTKW